VIHDQFVLFDLAKLHAQVDQLKLATGAKRLFREWGCAIPFKGENTVFPGGVQGWMIRDN
jgi:hypothetical protein